MDPKIIACYIMVLKEARSIDHGSMAAREAISAIESNAKYPYSTGKTEICLDVAKILVARMVSNPQISQEF